MQRLDTILKTITDWIIRGFLNLGPTSRDNLGVDPGIVLYEMMSSVLYIDNDLVCFTLKHAFFCHIIIFFTKF